MKKILIALLLCLVLPFSAAAVEDVDDANFYGSGGSGGLSEEEIIDLINELNPPEVTTLYRTSEITERISLFDLGAEDQTMRDVVVMILGNYEPQMQTVTEYLSDGTEVTYTEVVPGVAGLDWNWIGGAALFSLALFSFFKIVGVVLKHG